MITLVFFLEEPSAKAMLEGLLPRLFPAEVVPRFVVFEGKQDLEKQLERRLRGWLLPDSVFVVLRDQDTGPCGPIKKRLVAMCQAAGHPEVLVRIACRELESFYLGDLNAVERALELDGLEKHSATRKFRDPDRLSRPSDELKQLTTSKYQKLSGTRAIGPELSLSTNRSHSFKVLVTGLRRVVEHHQAQQHRSSAP